AGFLMGALARRKNHHRPDPRRRSRDCRRRSGQDNKSALKIAKAGIALAAVAALALAGVVIRGKLKSHSARPYVPRQPGALTFNKEIAPIIFSKCSGCHRPGQAAPFNLLNYADVKKHAPEIADVTARRYMPPWLPEHGYGGEFIGDRSLTGEQAGLIAQWIAEGAKEGR